MTKLNQTPEQAATAKKTATKVAKPAKAAKRKPGEPRGAKVEKVTTDARQAVQRPAPKPPAKAKKAPAAPAKKAAPAKAKAPAKASGEFGVQVGSNQERLLHCLKKAAGKPVELAAILTAVYGKDGKSKAGALAMVIGGLKTKAQAHGHVVVRERDDTGPTLKLIKGGERQ